MKISLSAFLLLIVSFCHAQLIQKSGSLYDEVATIISSMPVADTDDYQDPSNENLDVWLSFLDEIFLGNYNKAAELASTIEYDLIEYIDTSSIPNHIYYLLHSNNNNYWGTYVFNPNYCRPVIIQSPHPKRDVNTGNQGIHVFLKTNALCYMLSGTHRCNSTALSTCSGTTTACTGSSEKYPISDLSHTTTSIFQKTTEALFIEYKNAHFIQLHGFSKLDTDPYVILSNGTQDTPDPDYLMIFSQKLSESDPTLTTKIAHIDLSWTRLRGFFNCQGRFINNSDDPCNTNALTTEGRFFHVEQERTKLRSDSNGWNKIAYAINNTFACSSSYESTEKVQSILIYPNPASDQINVEYETPFSDIKIYDRFAQNVSDRVTVLYNSSGAKVILGNLASGIYFLQSKNHCSRIVKL